VRSNGDFAVGSDELRLCACVEPHCDSNDSNDRDDSDAERWDEQSNFHGPNELKVSRG
jgi:hypothetical protein